MTLSYLCTLDLPDEWFTELADRLPDVQIHRSAGQDASSEVLAELDMLHTSEWFPEASAVPSLRCVQLDTSGVDHVRTTSLWDTRIPIATLGGIAPVPMAEYAMMTILELSHRMPLIQRLRDTRSWPSNADRLAHLTPRRLEGATVGIVGYGRIGREISRLANTFGMRVLGLKRSVAATSTDAKFDTGRRAAADDPTELFPMDRIDDVLRQSDILVVVVPLTELTRGMIGAEQLDVLPEGALVVNIARGGIVDEDALRTRLRAGRIGGVALDVFDEEPLPADSPWWSEPGALITPHVAGLAPQYHAQTLDLVVENLTRLADGRPVLNEVDRVSGY
ncbi:D-2-hydroxyacid dehydrogenase [Microbacterium hominis]|uniref:D-2-hydroxyacid dehydrogenase n=1 Tax=Microbacterium hominis TaxID=162426 RepID=A0A7D4UH97_9MICO|nr:D-2-hydroxyacid dehydrogenase [Microbacterium hominis]QKJ18268.1 D-2-hydroxyacid dehydrogenase [Microbacterium hominis]